MISEARLAANRANARKSTGPRTAAGKLRVAENGRKSRGPKTAAGKARASRNALRHGLNRPASADPQAAAAILELARAISGGKPHLLADVLMFAAARIDIARVRSARAPMHAHLVDNPADCKELHRLCAAAYYERRAYTREKRAVRRFDEALLAGPDPLIAPICENEPKPPRETPLCENEPNPT